MYLRTVRITGLFADMDKLCTLNAEAFPENERLRVEDMLAMAAHQETDFMAVYDDSAFVAFYLVFRGELSAYIYFFAVTADKRSLGYGSAILRHLREEYGAYQLVLDLEELDEAAENYRQRLTRKHFYLRNGCRETGYGMEYVGMRFEVLVFGTARFLPSDFQTAVERASKIINSYSSNLFLPRIYTIAEKALESGT